MTTPVNGTGVNEPGVTGTSQKNDGVLGVGKIAAKAGVAGVNDSGGNGVYARGRVGVAGTGKGGSGVYGESDTEDGVLGRSFKSGKAGVAGVNDSGGNGVYGRATLPTAGYAGYFDGHVRVLHNLDVPGAFLVQPSNTNYCAFFDRAIKVNGKVIGAYGYAEIFDAEAEMAPGTVVVIGDNGLLAPCSRECDTKVVGVVLDNEHIPENATASDAKGKQENEREGSCQVAIAMAGQISVLADPQYGEVSPGDLLTTSPTAGCAMLVKDRQRASGAIIGKALSSLDKETGLIRMLVMAT
ncbi:hypothetical protein ACIQNK_13740 [Streptomyces sp. NPDC091273]|uniref:hypothetical protein n=1 Tax=Streptomyces sp. NPDC091273 TaxID=3365982 RepID=UPI00380EF737